MSRNIEIKARIASVEALAPKAAAIADQGPIEIIQDDTFFSCATGRLKLRVFSQEKGELMARLGVEPSQLVEGAYVDLLANAAPRALQ